MTLLTNDYALVGSTAMIHKLGVQKYIHSGHRYTTNRLDGTRGASKASLLITTLIGFLGYAQIFPNAFLILCLFGVVWREFQIRITYGIPMMHIASLLAILQWLIGPLLQYVVGGGDGVVSMRVPDSVYFHYALPGTACFVLGLLAFSRSIDFDKLLEDTDRSGFLEVGIFLIGISILGSAAGALFPGSLSFAFVLLAQLRNIGALYCLYSPSRWRYIVIVLAIAYLTAIGTRTAMFHELFLWLGILACYWISSSRPRMVTKLVLLAVSILSVFSVQTVKADYREKVWHGQDSSLVQEIVSLWMGAPEISRGSYLDGAVERINQGWIVSAVMAHVPYGQGFANGETLVSAIGAALLPRLIYTNKAIAGGSENFVRFTGIPLVGDTSMNISLLGESYANFGIEGGFLLMGLFGAGMAFAFSLCIYKCKRYPTFLFWIPLIFYQAIKAETDFTEVLNHMFKGGMVAVLVFGVVIRVYPAVTRMGRRPSANGKRQPQKIFFREMLLSEQQVNGPTGLEMKSTELTQD